jgi:hypothetical protein
MSADIKTRWGRSPSPKLSRSSANGLQVCGAPRTKRASGTESRHQNRLVTQPKNGHSRNGVSLRAGIANGVGNGLEHERGLICEEVMTSLAGYQQ